MKLLNLLLLAAIALTAIGIVRDRAEAQAPGNRPTAAYSVTNLTADASRKGVYVATVSVSPNKRATAHRSAVEWVNGDVLRLSGSCDSTVKNGESGILLEGTNGFTLLASGGARCSIQFIDLAEQH